MKIPRFYKNFEPFLLSNKVLVIYGPRQVGKTTLLKDYLKSTKYKYRLDSGDDIRIQRILGSQNTATIKEYAEGYDLIAIDEAQRIPGVGIGLKIMTDQIDGIRIIVTGSSSFELAGQVGEPLTGRKRTLTLYPVSHLELKEIFNTQELRSRLIEDLVFGGYPEVVAAGNKNEKARILHEISGSYLLKDILEFDRVRNARILLDLLRLVAFQVGNEVSLTELGQQINADYKTVGRYLDLLEKSFVLFCLRGFSRNLRKEIVKKNKYYFYDNGIRNSLIANFNPLETRNDAGILWENFLFMERLKKRTYQDSFANAYFWRTWDQKEIDLIEERDGKLFAYEFKWGNKRIKTPKDWMSAYPESEFHTITQENYLDFIG